MRILCFSLAGRWWRAEWETGELEKIVFYHFDNRLTVIRIARKQILCFSDLWLIWAKFHVLLMLSMKKWYTPIIHQLPYYSCENYVISKPVFVFSGITRQLSHRREDGSFAIWGDNQNYPSSTWWVNIRTSLIKLCEWFHFICVLSQIISTYQYSDINLKCVMLSYILGSKLENRTCMFQFSKFEDLKTCKKYRQHSVSKIFKLEQKYIWSWNLITSF